MMSKRARHGNRDGVFAGSMAQRAIIDIGSNTVRLVIYGGSMRAPTVLLNEKVTAKLGRDMATTGDLAPEAIDLAMRGLERFALLLSDHDITDVETVATAAVRDARNGPEFLARLEQIGLSPRVISGEVEACLSASGVAGAFPGATGTVADLGGGSLELVRIEDSVPHDATSLTLGTLRLPEYRGKSAAQMRKTLIAAIEDEAGSAAKKVIKKAKKKPLYLVGGTWRCMAVYAMQEQNHPLSDPHGFSLSADDAMTLAKTLAGQDAEALKGRERISSMRAEKLPDAAVLLQALLTRLSPEEVVFSSWGLREGLLYDRLPDEEKMQDPLLSGVAVFASGRGAPATLATRIAGWTVGARPNGGHGNERLRLAATMLALASMQIEPNIRLPQAINWALHKRWIALDAAERAMIAATIAANGNMVEPPDGLVELAGQEAIDDAMCWGYAVRLARRLGARSRQSLQSSRLRIEDDRLTLSLAESHAALFGYSTEKDMKLLSGKLGLDWTVKTVADDELHSGLD